MADIFDIIQNFDFRGKFISVTEFGSGHINSTFLVKFSEEEYVLQRINTNVFKKPEELMENVFAVTEHIRNKRENASLNFVKTKSGEKLYKTDDGECFRAYVFVKNSVCYDSADTPELFEKSGEAFGEFQNFLSDFDASKLFETIPNFHDTYYRYNNEFLFSLKAAGNEKIRECEKEISYIISQRLNMNKLSELYEIGLLPLRVTHNDTKLNNVLFDKETGNALCVIDLDTVMPGFSLYDFGDSIRFGASTAAEDEKKLDKVSLSLEYFEAYARGYLKKAGDTLTDTEKDNLAFSSYLMTLECGMRFLTDYLNGSVYFKTDYETHNLVRARNQLRLAQDIFSKLDEMNRIIKALD